MIFEKTLTKVGSTCGSASVKSRSNILDQLVNNFTFESVLDVGCGVGDFFHYLNDKNVEFSGAGVDCVDEQSLVCRNFTYIKQDFMSLDSNAKFDLVFSSHTIEHIPDTGMFLTKFFSLIKKGGSFCIIWPPPKKHIVGGHVHIFNMGLMLYNIIRVGVDCSNVKLYRSGYNLAIMGKYFPAALPPLTWNRYELEALASYFPCDIKHNFNGDLNHIVKRV